jgi:hypothetical protein
MRVVWVPTISRLIGGSPVKRADGSVDFDGIASRLVNVFSPDSRSMWSDSQVRTAFYLATLTLFNALNLTPYINDQVSNQNLVEHTKWICGCTNAPAEVAYTVLDRLAAGLPGTADDLAWVLERYSSLWKFLADRKNWFGAGCIAAKQMRPGHVKGIEILRQKGREDVVGWLAAMAAGQGEADPGWGDPLLLPSHVLSVNNQVVSLYADIKNQSKGNPGTASAQGFIKMARIFEKIVAYQKPIAMPDVDRDLLRSVFALIMAPKVFGWL